MATDVTLEATAETSAETKVKQEILAVASVEKDDFDQLLDKFNLVKVLGIGAWIQRFLDNCRTKPKERKSGPIQRRRNIDNCGGRYSYIRVHGL
jgi:hypothetical protein